MRIAPDRLGIRLGSRGGQVGAPRGRRPDGAPPLHFQPGIGLIPAVRGGAGPPVPLGFGYHSRTHGVKLGVSQCRPEVRLVERAGIIPSLPEVPGGGMAGIAVGGVAAMGVLEGEKERIVASGDDDQVDVVGHEAITGQREAMDGAVVAEEVEIDQLVGVGFENGTAAIPSLGDVVRSVESDDASETCHANRQCGTRAHFLKKTFRLSPVLF